MSHQNDDDALLNELGGFLREEEGAMTSDPQQDPFGPLDEAEQDALTASLLSRLGARDAQVEPEPSAKVISLPSSRQSLKWFTAALSAAAAALFMFWPRASVSELPAYALVLPSADAEHRAAAAPHPMPSALSSYLLGRELEVLLRPATRVATPVAGRAFIEGPGGELEPLLAKGEPAEGGGLIFRIATGQGTRLLAPRSVRLHFVVGPAETLPSDTTVLTVLPAGAQDLVWTLRLVAE